jgi:hypothetical protein
MQRVLAFGLVAAAAVGVSATTAQAATTATDTCTTRSTAKKFQPVDGDFADYFTAPSGTFETGASGWTLTGAAVGSGNEPKYVNGFGSKSLKINSGGKAVSPNFCNRYGEQSIRFFYSGSPGARIHLHLDVTNSSTNDWAPLDWEMTVPSSGWAAANGIMMPYLYVEGQENLKITFTAIGGSVVVDDVEIDPFRSI